MKKTFKNQIRIQTPLTTLNESHSSYITLSLPKENWVKKPSLSLSRPKVFTTYASRPETARNSLISPGSSPNLLSPKSQNSLNSEKGFPEYSNHESFIKVHESILKKSLTSKSCLQEKQPATSSFISKLEVLEKKSFKGPPFLNITKLVHSPLVSLSKVNSAEGLKQKTSQMKISEEFSKKVMENQDQRKFFFDFKEINQDDKKVVRVLKEKKNCKKSKKKKKVGGSNNDALIIQRFLRFSLN
jgi:hypothetical protein